MTIKQLGGVFGRNPTFNDVTIEGQLTFDGALDINSDINLPDNKKITFGNGSDLQIYHDGSNSYVADAGTGDLILRGSTGVKLQSGSGVLEYLSTNSSTGSVELKLSGATKLATTSTGIDVTGTVTADGLTVDTDTLYVDATNNRVGIGTSSPSAKLHIDSGASNDGLYIDSDTAWNSTISLQNNGSTKWLLRNVGGGANAFSIYNSGGSSEAMRIDSSGHAIIPAGVTLGTAAGTYNADNTLDDYEEGTWTPTNAGDATGVITGEAGQYTKIGRLVQCQCQFQVTTNFTSNAIDGLPFVPRMEATLSNQYGSYAVNSDGTGNVFFRINDAGTSANFQETTGQGGTDHLPNTTNNRYMFCFTYETDS